MPKNYAIDLKVKQFFSQSIDQKEYI